MFGGIGGMDPKKMQAVMKQMGIKQEEVDSLRVIIEKSEGGRIVIENPNVVKIDMKGNESWQITGDAKEEEASGFSDSDVELVMEKTGKTKEDAKKALEQVNGDIAQAIIKLSE